LFQHTTVGFFYKIYSRVEHIAVPSFHTSKIVSIINGASPSNLNKKFVSCPNEIKNRLNNSILIKLRAVLPSFLMKILICFWEFFEGWSSVDFSLLIVLRF